MHNTQDNAGRRRIKIFNSLEKATQQVPVGSLRKLKIGNITLCLANTAKGWYAIQDACPHQGASLSGGKLNQQQQVICPLHQYSYNLQTGQEGGKRTAGAQIYTVQEEEGQLYIYL